MDSARLELRSYRRPFRQPLKTSHGLWSLREGILLRLTDAEGRVGWGEIAPITFNSTMNLNLDDDGLAFVKRSLAELDTSGTTI
jgi:O-succinylbenzoate synthase